MMVSQLQLDLGLTFTLEEDHIENHVADDGQAKRFESHFRATDVIYGMVSRGFHEELQASITLIASNHGRFVAAMTAVLTDDKRAGKFLQVAGFDPSSPLPPRFELVVGVKPPSADDNQMRSYPFEIVAKRIET